MKMRWLIWDSGLGGWMSAICFLIVSIPAVAEPTPPEQTQTAQVVQAHRAVASAQADVRFVQYFSYSDETEFATASYRVLFDRESRRVRIDRPGYTLISDGTDVLLVAEALPGRHLKMPLEGRFTYEKLVEVFPDLSQPIAPALVMLVSDSPIEQLSGGQSDSLERNVTDHVPDDRAIYLDLPVSQGTARLTVSEDLGLIESMLVEFDPQMLAGSGIDAVRLNYDIEWSRLDEPIDDSVFDLDLRQSHEMTTLAAFLSPNGGNAQPGPGGQGGGVPQGGSLVGMPLPEIELELLGSEKKIKLSDLNQGVVVLECFATWSKTSVLDLPALADFRDWCAEQGHEAAVYSIAVGEQADYMTKWMEALEKTAKRDIDLPVLLDTSTKAAMAMKLPTVPRTLIIVDGRVVEVYGGVKPEFLTQLKKSTPGWLEKVVEDAEEED